MEPILSQKQLCEKLHPFFNPIVADQVDSTSTWLKEHASSFPEGTVLFARKQTAGKGRNGNRFCSQPDKGLYFSLLLKPETSKELFLPVSLLCAAAAASALNELYAMDCQIKWVNDLMAGGRKIGGILCESLPVSKTRQALIIGIGINVYHQSFPEDLQKTAGCVQEFAPQADIHDIAAAILNRLYHFHKHKTSEEIHGVYMDCFGLQNQTVTVIEPAESYEAKVLDVDLQGRLIVQKEHKKISLVSSEIHIRQANLPSDSD